MTGTTPRRSTLLVAAGAYWRWLGNVLTSCFATRGRRRRSWVLFGGLLTWLVLIVVMALIVVFVAELMTAAFLALVAVGLLLSGIGWIDEARLALMHKPRLHRLPPEPRPDRPVTVTVTVTDTVHPD